MIPAITVILQIANFAELVLQMPDIAVETGRQDRSGALPAPSSHAIR
jgi:hypothetical protein